MLDLRERKNIRLNGYDYSQNGSYFVTICIKDKHNLLWENDAPECRGELCSSEKETPKLSSIGKIIDNEINKIPEIYENVKIDKYVIMPNHIHLIILIDGVCNDGKTPENIQNPKDCGHPHITPKTTQTPVVGANCVRPSCSSAKEPPTISRIIKQFKGSISKQIGYSIWQKLFYDHIIRNNEEYNKIWQYIDENPMKWQNDCYYEQ